MLESGADVVMLFDKYFIGIDKLTHLFLDRCIGFLSTDFYNNCKVHVYSGFTCLIKR